MHFKNSAKLEYLAKAYHVLTVAQKIQEIANRKMQIMILKQQQQQEVREPSIISHQNKINFQQQEQQIERQTVISYATNTTERKRLFESPSSQNMPKQLVKISNINSKPISQVQLQNKSQVKQEQQIIKMELSLEIIMNKTIKKMIEKLNQLLFIRFNHIFLM